MKKPFVVFGFLLTLFASAIFGDYVIPRGDFSPRLAGSADESLQQTFGDFLAGVTGGWATNSSKADQAPRSDVAVVASANRVAGANADAATSAATNSSGAATGRAVSSAVRSSPNAAEGGASAALGGGGGGGGAGANSSASGSGRSGSGGGASAKSTDRSGEGDAGDAAVAGGIGGGAGRRASPERSSGDAARSGSDRSSNNSDVNGLPPTITNPIDNLFDNGGLGPVVQDPLTEYLGATPGPANAQPSWLTQPETEKSAAAPGQAAAVVAQDVPDLSGTLALLALPMVGLTLLRRRRR